MAFPAAVIDPVVFDPPWTLDFDRRIARLAARRRRIAYFFEEPDPWTFRYRVYNMVRALEAVPDGEISASWFHSVDLARMERFVDPADALVVCRARYTPPLERMIARAKARGIPVVFDVDDLVFDPAHAPLLMHSIDEDSRSSDALDSWFARIARIGTTLRLCDRALATNEFLAERIRAFVPQMAVGVVPNFLNEAQQQLSSRLYEAKERAGFRSDGRIHIGYFSGTPSHNRDFAVAAPALARLLDEDERLVLRVVGYLDRSELLTRYAGRIDRHPKQDLLNLQRLVAEVEINIAPLQDNSFTNCKSELKFFEAAIVGSITVASPLYTFRRAIADGSNSLLARPDQWLAKLREAIALVDRPERYADMAQRGYREVAAAYGWDRFGGAIAAALFSSPPDRQNEVAHHS